MKQQAQNLNTCGECAHKEPGKGEMGALGYSRCKFAAKWQFITDSRPACPRFALETEGGSQ